LDSWALFEPDALPEPLYPPSAMLLATWRGRPAPTGWQTYPTPYAGVK
jgi:8-oxo-dGTP diphosphatase